jgi:nucleolin
VGNLPWTVTEDKLAELFSRAGRVTAVRVIFDRVTQRSLGYGFVELDGVSAEKAVSVMDGVEVRARRLAVGPARPPRR